VIDGDDIINLKEFLRQDAKHKFRIFVDRRLISNLSALRSPSVPVASAAES
jgi:hypothetical protein